MRPSWTTGLADDAGATSLSPAARLLALVVLAAVIFGGLAYVLAVDPRLRPPSATGAKGFVLYSLGDYAGATAAYRAHYRALARQSSGRDSLWTAVLAGDVTTARNLAQARIGGRYSRDGWLTLAEIALAEGQPAETLRLAAHVLEQERDQFDALLLSMAAHAQQRAWPQAIQDLNRALRHWRIESRITSFWWALEMTGKLKAMPASERPLCLLAHLHRYLRIFDAWNGQAAIRYAERAIAAGDQPADALLAIAIVRDKQDKPHATFEALTRALAIDPRHPEVLRWAAKSYSDQGDVANEYRMLKTAVEAVPDDPVYLTALSEVLIRKLGDYRQARQVGEQALRAGIRDAEIHRHLGHVHLTLGQSAAALTHYEQAIRMEPAHSQAYLGMGWALLAVGRSPEAIAALERGVQLASYLPDAHIGLARAYQRVKRHRDALIEFQTGIRMAMEIGDANFWDMTELCTLYRRVGELERADQCFRFLLAIQPGGSPVVFRRLAEIQESLRLEREAR